MLTSIRSLCSWAHLALFLVLLASVSISAADRKAGEVEFIEGDIKILDRGGHLKEAKLGAIIREGDTIRTGPQGELHMKTADEGYLALRPNTKVLIKVYRANADKKDGAIIALFRGTLRAISGWIGKYNATNYAISTGVATIGVRGTDHEPAFIAAEVRADSLAGEAGAYDKVNTGSSFIRNEAGTMVIEAGQTGYASYVTANLPIVLDRVPAFYAQTKNESRIDQRKDELSKSLDEAYRSRAAHSGAASHQKTSERSDANNPAQSENPGRPERPDRPDPLHRR
jgi:FecR-like protein